MPSIILRGSGQSESTRAPPPEPTYMRKQLDARLSLHFYLGDNSPPIVSTPQTATAPDGTPLPPDARPRCNKGVGSVTDCANFVVVVVTHATCTSSHISRLPHCLWPVFTSRTRGTRLGSQRTSTLTSASPGSQFIMRTSNSPLLS